MPDQYTLPRPSAPRTAPAPPTARDGRDRPGLQPHARGRRSRRWSTGTTSATARSSTDMPAGGSRPAALFGDPARVRSRVRAVDRVLAGAPHLVRADVRRRQPRARRARRPPARDDRHRPRTRATTCRSRSSPTIPTVMDRIAGWGWQDGLQPSPHAPVWPMDAFRDRFLTAYGPSPHAVRQDDRAGFDRALHHARVSAYATGRVRRAGELHDGRRDPRVDGERPTSARGSTVLDLCCGVAGPGRFLTQELGCAYLGVRFERKRRGAIARRARGRPAVPLRDRAGPTCPGGVVRRRAPARDDAGLRGQGRADVRHRRGPWARRAASPSRSRRERRSRRAESAAMPDADTVWLNSRSTRSWGHLSRASGHVAGGPQCHAPRDGTRAGGRLRRGRREHRRANQRPDGGRPCWLPSAVDQMAGRRTGPEVRSSGPGNLVMAA